MKLDALLTSIVLASGCGERGTPTCSPNFKSQHVVLTDTRELRDYGELDCLNYCDAYAYPKIQVSDCDAIIDTGVSEIEFTCEGHTYCLGRAPLGYQRHEPTGLRSWLVTAWQDESAAITAFCNLAADLRRLGAPEDLVRRATSSASDEARHANLIRRLICEMGLDPSVEPPTLPSGGSQSNRTLLDVATENAVEGVVGECWAAIINRHQSICAADVAIRRTMQKIAGDEAQHASLAMAVHTWAKSQLQGSARASLDSAMLARMARLRVHLRTAPGPHAPILGLPTTMTARTMFHDVRRSIWQPALSRLGPGSA